MTLLLIGHNATMRSRWWPSGCARSGWPHSICAALVDFCDRPVPRPAGAVGRAAAAGGGSSRSGHGDDPGRRDAGTAPHAGPPGCRSTRRAPSHVTGGDRRGGAGAAGAGAGVAAGVGGSAARRRRPVADANFQFELATVPALDAKARLPLSPQAQPQSAVRTALHTAVTAVTAVAAVAAMRATGQHAVVDNSEA